MTLFKFHTIPQNIKPTPSWETVGFANTDKEATVSVADKEATDD